MVVNDEEEVDYGEIVEDTRRWKNRRDTALVTAGLHAFSARYE